MRMCVCMWASCCAAGAILPMIWAHPSAFITHARNMPPWSTQRHFHTHSAYISCIYAYAQYSVSVFWTCKRTKPQPIVSCVECACMPPPPHHEHGVLLATMYSYVEVVAAAKRRRPPKSKHLRVINARDEHAQKLQPAEERERIERTHTTGLIM